MSNHNIVNEGMTDAAANAQTSAALTAGETFHGYLDGRDDNDWIRVELAAGASYMITVAGRDPDGAGTTQMAAADTVLEILDADGNRVAMKDDLTAAEARMDPQADTNHPMLVFEPEADGVYYLSVSSYNLVAATNNFGGYSLELTELDPPPDPNRDMTLAGTATPDKLIGAGGQDNIRGGSKDNPLDSQDNRDDHDFLSGGDANDELFGESGDDTLEGGPGADTLNGGAGSDTITYARSTEAVTVNLGKATATGGEAEGDVIENVENIIGSSWDDWLRGDTNDNVLTGGAGDDTLIGGGGGNDMLMGGAGDDELNGGEGNDTLNGGAGADMLNGGPGMDIISYAGSDSAVDIRLRTGHASGGHAEGDVFAAVESVTGSDHNDRLAGDNRPAGEDTGGDNTLSGGGGDDEIYGGSGDDTLNGGAGDDALYGGAGDDTLDGGAGDDALIGGAGGDSFTGGDGEDTVSYANARDEKVTVDLGATTGAGAADANNPSHSDGDYFPSTDVENVIGSPRGDTITGSNEANKIWGGAGADTINGGDGDDTLDGGPGGDTFTGGDGSDTVTYEASDAGVRVTVNSASGNEGGHAEGDRLSTVENLVGSSYNDRLFGDGLNNMLSGGAGNDMIVANAGDDTVEGGAGADTLDGDDGENGFALGAGQGGADTLSYESSAGGVTIDLSRQYAAASARPEQIRAHYATGTGGDASGDKFRGFENITGGMGNDRLTGDGWSNLLIGGPGADVLDGGSGPTNAGADGSFGTDDDVMNTLGAGADGNFGTNDDVLSVDTVSYAGSSAGVTIAFSENTRRIENREVTTHDATGSGGDAEGDRLLNIDKVIGTAHNDTFIASKTIAEGQTFDGGANAMMDNPMTTRDETKDSDTVSYASFDTAVQIYTANHGVQLLNIENLIGGSGDDLLHGNARPNELSGGAGADVLHGEADNDTLIGGPGNDELQGGLGIDMLNGGAGGDILNGGAAGESLIDGRPFSDIAGGRADVDGMNPTSYGGDTVTYAGSNRGVTLTLGDVVLAGPDGTFGGANAADDFASTETTGQGGYAQGDTVQNVENIIGSDHADRLGGGDYHNVLTGGKGDDTLTGGGAGDIFVFAPGDSTGEDGDVITDFTIGTSSATRDAIDLRAFNFDIATNPATGAITTTPTQLEAQGLKISDLMDADEDGTEDDREITLPDGGKITLIGGAAAVGELTIDHFVFDLM